MFRKLIPVIILVFMTACANVQGSTSTDMGMQCKCCMDMACCKDKQQTCCKHGMCKMCKTHMSNDIPATKDGKPCKMCLNSSKAKMAEDK